MRQVLIIIWHTLSIHQGCGQPIKFLLP